MKNGGFTSAHYTISNLRLLVGAVSEPRRSSAHANLPAEVYIPLVDSLFEERRTFLIGAAIMTGAMALTLAATGEQLLVLTTIAFAAVSVGRFAFMHAYQRVRSQLTSSAEARKWETRYAFGAALSVFLMGLWSFVAFAATDDAFAQLVSFSMTIAYLLGVFGRNFGSAQFVVVQILCAWIPLTAALTLYGNLNHILFAVLIAPFFLTLKFISERFRRTLLDAIVARHSVSALADRFDTALTNMPHGLCMLDPRSRIVVVNERFKELLGIDRDIEIKGWRMQHLLRHCVRKRIMMQTDARRLLKGVETGLAADSGEIHIELASGATLAVSYQPMEKGGAVAQIQDISERRRAEQTITRMANYDPLTGLPNRNLFFSHVRPAMNGAAFANGAALHFIDLDHFKQVNDTLGHSSGDALLRQAAERLKEAVRRSDVAARFGGDEFVVLQSDVGSSDAAAALARRLVNEMSRPYVVDGEKVVVGASIGIARYPGDGTSLEQLLRSADMALYEAKAAGRGAIEFFSQEMDERLRKRRAAEINLRNAIERNELDVHFQPIVALASDRIVACEALLRWNHPERGLVPAGEFIAVAEETGAIAEVGQFVLETACRECRGWPEGVNVTVNVSPRQFERSEIDVIVREVLEKTGLAPQRLEIEITESAFLRNIDHVQRAIQELKAIGVSISLDDFGTGYSSLSYLHSFPFDKVKIDRSFVANLRSGSRSQTLLNGVARLSADLGLKVTVEGIETVEQLALVTDHSHFHEAQGFLFSRAISSTAIRQTLDSNRSGWVARHRRLPVCDLKWSNSGAPHADLAGVRSVAGW